MAKEFRLPDIGEGLTEAEVVRWLVPVGEDVAKDQPVVEVETDKAVVEIPSPYAGTVLEHGAGEGETLEVGSILVVIGDVDGNGEQSSNEDDDDESDAMVWDDPQEVILDPEVDSGVAPIVGTLDDEAEDLGRSIPASEPLTGGSVKALPLVRRLARERGVDLSNLSGSGPDGRITREDVLAAGEVSVIEVVEIEVVEEAVAETESGGEPDTAQTERKRMSRLRRTIADNMSRSWAEVPHVTTFDDIDATRLLEVRHALAERHGVRIPLEALVIRALLPALRAFPEFNASLDGEDLIYHHRHDVGVAVDTPDGLLVAVIRDAGSKGVLEIGAEVTRLAEGAKSRALESSELSGQTFTVSNIGAVGGGHGTPIVPPGTVGILSLGRAKDRVIVDDGDVVVAPVMPLSLSYDHRVIDGGQGRRFMAMLIENLEEPALFLAG